jgi:Spx/MgsR family transcriptional regulator
MFKMFGIPNCDTIKKAKKWLDSNNIEYIFHDYKKLGANAEVLEQAISATSVDVVVNKRGTTYRKLSEADQQQLSQESANVAAVIDLLCQHPSMIKRPILMKQDSNDNSAYIVGFSAENYQVFVNGA